MFSLCLHKHFTDDTYYNDFWNTGKSLIYNYRKGLSEVQGWSSSGPRENEVEVEDRGSETSEVTVTDHI